MFELQIIYTATLETGIITEAGIRAIGSLLSAESLPSLPIDWQYVWLVQSGDFRGTFPKRVSQFYHKQYKLKLSDALIANLGGVAKAHTQDKAIYRFDFTMTFDWYDGDFGDDGSCFWAEHAGALTMLTYNGAYAVRFYDDESGMGRAWLVRVEFGFIVFNGYGLETLEIARVLATYFKLTYRQIRLVNHGTPSGQLWVNGGYGYLVGQWSVISKIDSHDFKWENIYEYRCYDCGRELHEDDRYTGNDGENYCDSCFYEVYEYCAYCGETYYREDVYYIESEGMDYCEHCLDRHFVRCDECEEYYRRGDVIAVNGRVLCENCQPEESEE